jgi:hypothetical protein
MSTPAIRHVECIGRDSFKRATIAYQCRLRWEGARLKPCSPPSSRPRESANRWKPAATSPSDPIGNATTDHSVLLLTVSESARAACSSRSVEPARLLTTASASPTSHAAPSCSVYTQPTTCDACARTSPVRGRDRPLARAPRAAQPLAATTPDTATSATTSKARRHRIAITSSPYGQAANRSRAEGRWTGPVLGNVTRAG